jgi:hypothetical protein
MWAVGLIAWMATPSEFNIWDWLSDTISAESIVQALGLTALAILFATNRILTLGQHTSRIKDLKEHHEKELTLKDSLYSQMVAEKDRAYAEMKEARNYWQSAASTEKNRADSATTQLVESNEVVRLAAQMVDSLDHAVKEAKSSG